VSRTAVGPLVLVPVLTLGLAGCSGEADADQDRPAAPTSAAVQPSATQSAQPVTEEESFDLTRHSIDDPRSTWVVVNKRRALRPPTYTPEQAIVEGYLVHPRVVRPLTRLLVAGRRHGLDLRIMSAFRSYGRQAQLYAGAVAAQGAERAARTTAPAGHSEHQTGLAVDLGRASTGECNIAPCFAATREGRWLRRHAHRFGFVLRYPRGNRPMTGYAHESWHFRFVGRPLATHLRRDGIATLEDAFGLVGGGS
jgi:D-alanyl-D-alanine carboxypeptidase